MEEAVEEEGIGDGLVARDAVEINSESRERLLRIIVFFN